MEKIYNNGKHSTNVFHKNDTIQEMTNTEQKKIKRCNKTKILNTVSIHFRGNCSTFIKQEMIDMSKQKQWIRVLGITLHQG